LEVSPRSGDANRLKADELRFTGPIAILEEHGDHFAEIRVELVQALGLCMCAGQSRHVPDEEPGVRIALNHGCVQLRALAEERPVPGAQEDRGRAARSAPWLPFCGVTQEKWGF
jgi:hypothetical protein